MASLLSFARNSSTCSHCKKTLPLNPKTISWRLSNNAEISAIGLLYIVNFSNVSWDHFYAHTDATSLDGTIFEGKVAHGYFILSAAAGLFVQAKKGPVLLNYGIEDCRFTKPVYPGMTIGVRFTVKEKIAQEKRDEDDVPKGIVKFLVDVYDETDETVAIATILTMIKRRSPLE